MTPTPEEALEAESGGRLLSEERLIEIHSLFDSRRCGPYSRDEEKGFGDLFAHIAALCEQLAAQDQRRAALVEAAKVIVQEPDTFTQYLDRVAAVEEALAALAQPPGE